ncbi:hypothetical protein PHISCL_10266 [Aspergillus sclerotialis]|uniref:Uncharacterized protein n=1 Tax=Aspergillus sclerotialis TaxID=2070753 RepID=A0A3A2Z7X5_9EURO|nr:hypothetical protein PHISCL_10266 [Aspergillus sclerotialis]
MPLLEDSHGTAGSQEQTIHGISSTDRRLDGTVQSNSGTILAMLSELPTRQLGIDSLLPLAQFAYNSSKNATTGTTPFFANYGREPEIERTPLKAMNRIQEAEILVEQLKNLHEALRKDIEFTNERMKHYYDIKRQEAP